MKELKTFTTGKGTYDSFPDKTARAELPKKLTRPATAKVGDYLRIKAIGADGTMEVEAVPAPTGGNVDLTGYATEVWVQELLAEFPTFKIEVVQELPAVGVEKTIYLVPFADDSGSYLEYLYVNGAWEVVGNGKDSGENVTYEGLPDKPKINGVELSGNKSLESLGIGTPTPEQISSAVSAYLAAHPEAITDKPDVRAIGKGIITGVYKSISLIGDSVTAGAGGTGYEGTPYNITSNKGYCWANILKKYLGERFGISVTNYGMHGSTTEQIRAKIDTIVPDGTDLVVFLCGINDRTEAAFPVLQSTLGTFLDEIAAKGADILIMTGTPFAATGEASKPHHMDEIEEVIVSNAYGKHKFFSMYQEVINYVESRGLTINKNFLCGDGLHPGDEGYLIMFRVFCEQIGLPINIHTDFTVNSEFWQSGNSGDIEATNAMILSASSLSINSGESGTFTVALENAPADSVTVNVASGSVALTVDKTVLTFNSDNYSTPQTVTCTAGTATEDVTATVTVSADGMISKFVSVYIAGVGTANMEYPLPDGTEHTKAAAGDTFTAIIMEPLVNGHIKTIKTATGTPSDGNKPQFAVGTLDSATSTVTIQSLIEITNNEMNVDIPVSADSVIVLHGRYRYNNDGTTSGYGVNSANFNQDARLEQGGTVSFDASKVGKGMSYAVYIGIEPA